MLAFHVQFSLLWKTLTTEHKKPLKIPLLLYSQKFYITREFWTVQSKINMQVMFMVPYSYVCFCVIRSICRKRSSRSSSLLMKWGIRKLAWREQWSWRETCRERSSKNWGVSEQSCRGWRVRLLDCRNWKMNWLKWWEYFVLLWILTGGCCCCFWLICRIPY